MLIGDATDPEVLREAGATRASRVVAAVGDDGINCRIAVQARTLVAETGSPKRLRCHVQVTSIETRRILQQHYSKDEDRFHFFDAYVPEARRLLVDDLPLDHDGIAEDDDHHAHLVLLGFGRMGRTVALRAAQLGIFANGRRLKISVVDRDAATRRGELLFHHPRLPDVCDIEFYSHEVVSPDTRALIEQWCARRDARTSVVVGLSDERRSLEIAEVLLNVVKRLRNPETVRVAIRAGESGFIDMLMAASAATSNVAVVPFTVFGTRQRAEENVVLEGIDPVGPDPDALAKAIHAAYAARKTAEAKSTRNEDDESAVEWARLKEYYRESNRQQADHIGVKLRALGLHTVDEVASFFAEKPAGEDRERQRRQIERLARWEHRRWVAERLVANWIDKESADGTLIENPNLAEWDHLDEATKSYDVAAVCQIPDLVTQAPGGSSPWSSKALRATDQPNRR